YTATATALESGYLLAISMALRSPFSARSLFAATLLRHLGARAAPPPMVSVALTKGLLACGGKAPIGHDSPMLITCTNCATSYQAAPSPLGPSGRSVRCARCQQVWFAANTEAMADVAEAHRADLAAIAETTPSPEAAPTTEDLAPALPPLAAEADRVFAGET